MNYALRSFAFATLVAGCAAAQATYCPDGSTIESHPGGICTPQNTGSSAEANAAQAQIQAMRQQQQQQQAQAQQQAQTARGGAGGAGGSSSSASSLNNAGNASVSSENNSRSASRSSANNNGNGNGAVVTLQGAQPGSGDSYTDRSVAVAWAPIIPAPAAPPLATANMVVVPGVCGPRHSFIRSDVQGRKFNSVGSDESFAVGTNDVLWPEDEPFINRNGYLMGSLITEIHAVPGTSAAGGFSIGGFSKGDGLQGGANGSSSVQQVTTRYTIKDCIYAMPQPRVVTELRTVYVDRPVQQKQKPRPKPKAKPACVPRAALVCPVPKV